MKKIGQKSGLTLVELIVASMLIAIVLLGVVAFNLSLTQIQDDSFNQSTLSIQASTAMNYLEDDISMAIGNNSNPGVTTRTGSITPGLCLRQPDATPLTMVDNLWICYFLDNLTATADHNLKRCVPSPINNIPDRISECDTNDPITNLVKLQDGNFFTVGDDIPFTPPGPGLIKITLNAQDGTGSYSMTTDIGMKNHSF